MRGLLALFAVGLAVLPAATACSSTTASSIWTVPKSIEQLDAERWLDLPWPNDLRRETDGTVRFVGMFNPVGITTIRDYLEATRGLLDGFSPVASGYFRFDGDVDPATLPVSPPESTKHDSAVQLIDIDRASPEYGRRRMVQTYFRSQPGPEGSYWLPHTLAAMPAQGYPLRPRTRYAMVVTKRIRAPGGVEIGPSQQLQQVLGLAKVTDATRAAKASAAEIVRELDQNGIAADYIVSLTWFRTNDPTADTYKVADWTKKNFPAPEIDPTTWKRADILAEGDVYEAVYGPAPDFQAGNIPFVNPQDGGSFSFDEMGNPIVQRTFTMRMSLVVPFASRCPMPADGYPIVLYAHGTGGDYRSVVSESRPIGRSLAGQCIASMGVDQIFHGTRPGAPPLTDPNRIGQIQTLFFNFANPLAARTNGRQSAIDVVQQARLFTVTKQTVPFTLSRSGKEVRFDPTRVIFIGHSQGGVNGPMFLAADDTARGGVLSGTGADIRIALLEKTKPSPSVAQAVRLVLGLSKGDFDDELNVFHPILNLAQTLIDPTDPYLYMRNIITEPRPGFAPKSIYQTEGVDSEGVGDHYAPPHGIELAAVALGLPVQAPTVHPIVEAAWSGLGEIEVPADGLYGNLAGGKATGLLAQFPSAEGSDGHFVLFDVPSANRQAAIFCKNLAADPIGRIPQLR